MKYYCMLDVTEEYWADFNVEGQIQAGLTAQLMYRVGATCNQIGIECDIKWFSRPENQGKECHVFLVFETENDAATFKTAWPY